jgi:uncharacterized protein (TIGR02453 family)
LAATRIGIRGGVVTYPGLPRGALDFLAGLAANNTRAWFEAHREDYARDWLAAGLDLVAALSEPAAAMGLLAVPKLNASLRRIHRDTRFSRDKTPYHPWLHLILSTGPAFNTAPGVHLVITPQGLGYGAGVYGLEPGPLEAMRRRICEDGARVRLLAALDAAKAVGSTLDPPDLARLPRGYAAADWDHLLRRKGLIVRTREDMPPPDWLFTPEAPAKLAAIVRSHLPLLDWLRAV